MREGTVVRLRATLAGDGRPGPIEERIGRRLVRLVDPGSEEAQRLFGAGRVDLVGPGGEMLGRMQLAEAWRRLRERLEGRLAEPDGPESDSLREGLDRLRRRSGGSAS